MIKSLKVENLNRRITCDLEFHPDINIITGKNGSGKTTVLKLLWYAISGNLERILPEMSFDSFELVTDSSTLHMAIITESKRKFLTITHQHKNDEKPFELKRPIEKGIEPSELVHANRSIYRRSGTSTFFPTFRRIEGGFSLSSHSSEYPVEYSSGPGIRRHGEFYFEARGGGGGDLQQAMNNLSERISVGLHRFVASISTNDINRLLTLKYAEISEKTNRLHMELSNFILKNVHTSGLDILASDGSKENPSPQAALEDIRRRARKVNEQSEALLRPFIVLNDLISRLFQYKGIKIAEPVTLGEAAGAIASDILSAGEKQMLSFLCYNAFSENSCVFIDEPEISLHVDWQRILFPVLMEQSTGNQFIVTTHSPFIYSKYSDKELILSEDKGDSDADS